MTDLQFVYVANDWQTSIGTQVELPPPLPFSIDRVPKAACLRIGLQPVNSQST
jgi:hypothetical protein